ncbi:lipopolysaccharide biosynthesis protein [Bradyrhizobium sp. ORS 86]|uniref:lipopolysaccharide biosynthesis protein n=1 Tax=Bradyrhizobium sp. ORS 86 TaxID=1685970 RepID=UPI00388F027C
MSSVAAFLQPKLPMLRLLAGSISSLAIGVLAQAVAFVLLARYLGTTQFGELTTISAVTALANTWCGFGPGEVLRRIVSRDASDYPEALGHTILMILITGIVLTVLLIGGMLMFPPPDGGIGSAERLQILLLLVPINVMFPSFFNLVENVFLAHGDFRRGNFINGGSGVARALAAVVACGLFGVTSLRDWALWWAAVHLAIGVICVIMIRRFGLPRWNILRREAWLGGNLAFSSFLIMLRHNVDVLVLSAVTSPDFVGVYGAGRRLIGAALVVPGAFDRVIYGKLAVAGKNGARASLRLATKYLPYSLLISAATSVGLFLVAPYASLVFGHAFAPASDVIRTLAWTVIPTAVQFLAFDALNAAEHHKVSTIVSGVTNTVGALMVVLLGSTYGTVGIYVALYFSDLARGGGLWTALNMLAGGRQSAQTRAERS